MSPRLKRILLALGGAVGLLVLLALVVPLFVDANAFKPQLEAAVSENMGMEVRVAGRVSLGFIPRFHLTLEGGRILDEQGAAVASVKRTTLYFKLIPLLQKEFRPHRIDLVEPRFSIERDLEGRLNVEKLIPAITQIGVLDGGSVMLKNATLLYADKRTGEGFEASGISLSVKRIRRVAGASQEPLKGLSLRAILTCAEIRGRALAGSALKIIVEGKRGVFVVSPITLRLFGAHGEGHLRADFTRPVPVWQARFALPGFRIEEFLKLLSPTKAAEGSMDFSMNLSSNGGSWPALVQNAAGDISLRGQNLALVGTDLDGAISCFGSSQNFNFVDVGAVLLAGPLGMAVTKGYNFASLFKGTGGTTKIGAVVSDWTVANGVARARDVAMTTAKNRLALQGGLDFVKTEFAELTVAVVNENGCSQVRQTIRGPFEKPEVEKPHMLSSLVGPLTSLLKKAKNVLPGPCDAFYSGSVAHPTDR